jgi:hypothetical protein
MSKSVLVIDTPEKGCISCIIGRDRSNSLETCIFCPVTGKCVLDKEAEVIPDWCPLKPLPEKMKVTGIYNGEYFKAKGKPPSYKIGWNKCIDEITGKAK